MAEFRSGVYSKPLELTKEDLKNLAKRQQKAKRDEEAKTAKIRPQTDNAPMGSSVSFDAPVKVSTKDLDKDNRKLTDILGPYERMSKMILSGTRGIVGVESQPATPLPSKTGGGTFFKQQAGKNSMKELYPGNPSERGREPQARRPDKPNSATECPGARMKENNADHRPTLKQEGKPQSVPPSHSDSSCASVSSTPIEKLNRSDTSRERGSRGGGSGSSQKSSNSHKVPQKSESSNQNVRKDTGRVIKKEVTNLTPGKPGNEDRVPVLQGLNQELIGQSKRESNQSASSASSNSKVLPNQQSHVKSAERTSKKPHSEPVTVLKESKDENRNAINGKFKDRPRLQIPQEKNVEDMLRELTHIPQPLTGLPTPSKDSKFPFQEKITEPLSKRGVKVESKQMVPEEIQEKDDSESSDSADSASGDEANDNDDDDEDGSGDSSDSGDSAKGDKGKSDDDHSDGEDDVDGGGDGNGSSSDSDEEDEEGIKSPEKVQPAPAKIPVPIAGNTAVKAPVKAAVKAPPGKQQGPMSSSDSSSSGSESSDSGSDSESVSDPSDTEKPDSPPPPPPEKEKVTPPKMKSTPDYMDDPSPSRQSWNLEAFLPPTRNDASGLLNMAKPLSLEAPSSNKSDTDQVDEVIDVKRSADHVSDENPQSVDQESVSKPMSADEFSPPAPMLDKQMLSPIKSPQSVKSPTKRTFHTPSVHDKGHSDTASAKTKSDPPVVYSDTNKYDSIKYRERKKSTSISSPDVIKEPVKQKASHAGRKAKKRSTPPTVPDDTSSSDSEIDIGPVSPRKSLSSVSKDNYKLSSVPSKSSSVKVKDTKKDKLLKEQNCVKLKRVDDRFPTDCDTLSAKPMSNMPPLMTEIFDFFTDKKVKRPLSPLRDCKNTEKVKNIKPDILPVKNLYNGSVKNLNGKPSVLVQIELNLLTKVMCKDKSDPSVLKIKPEMAKRLKSNLSIGNLKPPKVTNAKGSGTIIANKSHKVLESDDEEVSKSLPSASNHSTSNSQASVNNSQTSANHSSKDSANISVGRIFTESVPKSGVDVNRTAVPDFDSLPVREANKPELSESSSSESSSSDSEIEDDSKSSQPALVSSQSTSFNPSHSAKRKREKDSHHADDYKRQKTLPSKVLNSQSTPERASQKLNHDPNCEPSHEEVVEGSGTNSKKSSLKRERCNSTSSQHSTLSQHSTTSTHSRHSRHGTQGQRSQKKTKLSEPPSDLISTHSAESTAQSSAKSQSSSQSHVKSSPSALSTSSTSSSSKHGRSEVSDSSRKVNGHIPKNASSVPGRVNNHVLPASLKHGAEAEERLLSFAEYHKKATSYRHKAKAMPAVPHSLEKYYVFLESVLYFLLSGLACERDHQSTSDASNMFKETFSLMAHHYHQFRNLESDVTDKSDVKFTVLCLRIQSLLYMKLYKLKRTETIKLKKALDDHNNKSVKTTSQPKPPSAPSPHQTNWNRSTGTPSPMSPTPSPANSICSVGSVGSDQTPSKLTNGTSNSAPIAPPGFILVPQRIHSITQKYFTSTNYLVQAHEFWDQSESFITGDLKDFFVHLDTECGYPLTINSGLIHLVKYCRRGLSHLRSK